MFYLALPQQCARLHRSRLSARVAHVADTVSTRWIIGDTQSGLSASTLNCSSWMFQPLRSQSGGVEHHLREASASEAAKVACLRLAVIVARPIGLLRAVGAEFHGRGISLQARLLFV